MSGHGCVVAVVCALVSGASYASHTVVIPGFSAVGANGTVLYGASKTGQGALYRNGRITLVGTADPNGRASVVGMNARGSIILQVVPTHKGFNALYIGKPDRLERIPLFGNPTMAAGLTDLNTAAGTVATDQSPFRHAFITVGTQVYPLSEKTGTSLDGSGPPSSTARAFAGFLVVGSLTPNWQTTPAQAVVWVAGHPRFLGVSSGYSEGLAVTARGDVAGIAYLEDGSHGFFKPYRRPVIDLGRDVTPVAIDPHGLVTGWYRTAYGETRGFVWSKRGGLIDLAALVNRTGARVESGVCFRGSSLVATGYVENGTVATFVIPFRR